MAGWCSAHKEFKIGCELCLSAVSRCPCCGAFGQPNEEFTSGLYVGPNEENLQEMWQDTLEECIEAWNKRIYPTL